MATSWITTADASNASVDSSELLCHFLNENGGSSTYPRQVRSFRRGCMVSVARYGERQRGMLGCLRREKLKRQAGWLPIDQSSDVLPSGSKAK